MPWLTVAFGPFLGDVGGAAVLTGLHQGLPLVAPLGELLGVLPLHTGPLLEARHDVITRLEGVLRPLDRTLVVPRLEGHTHIFITGLKIAVPPSI